MGAVNHWSEITAPFIFEINMVIDSHIFDEIEDNNMKAKLCQDMLHSFVVQSPPPMDENTMWKCQLLSEMVAEYTERANSKFEEIKKYVYDRENRE